MDVFDAPPLWEGTNGKPMSMLGLINGQMWSLLSASSSAPVTASLRSTSSLKGFLSGVLDRIHSPYLIGGTLAVTAVAISANWFFNAISNKTQEQVSKVEAENTRLFQEIDRLSRDNELLLEGSHRATQLNQEVRKFLPCSSPNLFSLSLCCALRKKISYLSSLSGCCVSSPNTKTILSRLITPIALLFLTFSCDSVALLVQNRSKPSCSLCSPTQSILNFCKANYKDSCAISSILFSDNLRNCRLETKNCSRRRAC